MTTSGEKLTQGCLETEYILEIEKGEAEKHTHGAERRSRAVSRLYVSTGHQDPLALREAAFILLGHFCRGRGLTSAQGKCSTI